MYRRSINMLFLLLFFNTYMIFPKDCLSRSLRLPCFVSRPECLKGSCLGGRNCESRWEIRPLPLAPFNEFCQSDRKNNRRSSCFRPLLRARRTRCCKTGRPVSLISGKPRNMPKTSSLEKQRAFKKTCYFNTEQ